MKHRLSNLSKIYRDDICRKMNILPIVLCMFCMGNAYSLMAATPSVSETLQQNRKIKGRVVDVNNEPMIGVSVLEKGTTNGVITDFDGNFTLMSEEIQLFSYVLISVILLLKSRLETRRTFTYKCLRM